MIDVFLISEKNKESLQYNRYSILNNFFHFFFAIALSSTLLGSPTLGAAVYIFGEICSLVYDVFHQSHSAVLPDDLRGKGKRIIIFASILSGLGMVVSFDRLNLSQVLFICVLLCLIPMRTIFGNWIFVNRTSEASTSKPKEEFTRLISLYVFILVCSAVIIMFYKPMEANKRWILLVGFFLGSLLSLPSHWQSRKALHMMCLNNTKKEEVQSVWSVNAYQLFRQTFVYVVIALQVSLAALMYFLNHMSEANASTQLLRIVLALTCIFIVCLPFMYLINKNKQKIDFNNLLAAGAVIWLVGGLYLWNNWSVDSRSALYYFGVLSAIGCVLMLSSILVMAKPMQTVLKFGSKVEDRAIYLFTFWVMEKWSLLVSQLVLLGVFCVASFFVKNKQAVITSTTIQCAKIMIIVIPSLFILRALVLSFQQPLTKRTMNKLKTYIKLKSKGIENKALESQLRYFFVKKYRRRIGIKIIAVLLKPFCFHRVIGKENVTCKEGSAIFIANHSRIYGPIITNLYLPFFFRPWIRSVMVDKDAVGDHMYKNTFAKKKYIPKHYQRKIANLLAKPVSWGLNSTEPIPVYREGIREILKTIKLTVDAMQAGDNILLFPEDPDTNTEGNWYPKKGVTTFFTGFAHIGKSYYQRTGENCTFYPVYASRKRRIIAIGKGIEFNPENDARYEKERITNELHEAVVNIANELDSPKRKTNKR